MPQPTVIIELVDNRFEALYSDSELSFILVNRKDDGKATISGPHAPTVEKADLTGVIDGLNIPLQLLTARTQQPFFVTEETPL